MDSIILYLSFSIKLSKDFFVCSYVATIWLLVLNFLFVEVRLIASSSILFYFDMGSSCLTCCHSAISFATQTEPFCLSKVFFKKSRLPFIILFMRTAKRSREEIRFRIRLERVSAVNFPHFSKQLSYLGGYSRVNYLPQVPIEVSLDPSPTPQLYLHHRT